MIKNLLLLNYILLLYSCYTDITKRVIKNKAIIVVALLSILIGCLQYTSPVIIFPFIILFVGGGLVLFDFFGAGDIKLMFALSLSLSNALIIQFILATAIAGLIVVFPILIIGLCKNKKITVPYGIAISLGYCIITLPIFCCDTELVLMY